MSEDATTRERILAAIREFPGIHLRGLVRVVDTSTALARYHLVSLVEAGQVREVPVGGFVRYFPVEAYRDLTATDRRKLNLLRQERPLEIILTLLEAGPLQHRDLLELVGGSKATLTYQLDKLVAAGLVEKVAKGEGRGFHLRDPAYVRDLLKRYEPVPEAVERVHDLWDDLFRGHRKRRVKDD